MELTWIAILASLLMGLGAVLVFVFAVKKEYFRDLEDTKYHVFWPDLESPAAYEENIDGHAAERR